MTQQDIALGSERIRLANARVFGSCRTLVASVAFARPERCCAERNSHSNLQHQHTKCCNRRISCK
eukprot:scaffold11990_cov60-Cylindrotheca_fusiformis.AAC.2